MEWDQVHHVQKWNNDAISIIFNCYPISQPFMQLISSTTLYADARRITKPQRQLCATPFTNFNRPVSSMAKSTADETSFTSSVNNDKDSRQDGCSRIIASGTSVNDAAVAEACRPTSHSNEITCHISLYICTRCIQAARIRERLINSTEGSIGTWS
jgi:hypothetical protein